MLEHRGLLADARVLDLFAGSGSLGIEALSRGARHVVFVEESPAAVRVLRENVAGSGFADRAEVLPMPVPRALRTLVRRGVTFDGILIDPPYDAGWTQRLLEAVEVESVLGPDGWLALEHRPSEAPRVRDAFETVQQRRHGSTMLTLLARRGTAS
jgi:16S rRNA (guanine(966)-N(2))-methyltransferase RsmD